MDDWPLSDEPQGRSETSAKVEAELARITGDASRFHVGYPAWLAEGLGKPQAITVYGTQCDGAALLALLEQLPAGAPPGDVSKAIAAGVKVIWPPHAEPMGGVEIDAATGRRTYWRSDS